MSANKGLNSLLVFLLASLPSAVTAQDKNNESTLEPIVIQGTGGETGRGPVKGVRARQSASATKTDTPLQETPQAVTVVTRDQMDLLNASGLNDVIRYVPGTFDAARDDNRGFFGNIRGFSPDIYLDGLSVPPTDRLANYQLEPWGLERLEVLRGASSSVYGAGQLGGILNGVSKVPRADQMQEITVQAGSFGRAQTAFDFGGAADDDQTVLWRFNGLLRNAGTQFDNIDNDRIYLAPSVTWEPSADTSLTLLGSYMHDEIGTPFQQLPAAGTVLANRNGELPRDFLLGDRDFDKYSKSQGSIGYQFNHNFSDAWSFRQNARYSNVETEYRLATGGALSADQTTVARTAQRRHHDSGGFLIDNQLEGRFGTGVIDHDLLLGLDARILSQDVKIARGAAPSLNLYNPVYLPVALPSFGNAGATSTTQDQKMLGLYLQDQMSYDNWRLTLTGRQDWVESTTRNNKTSVKTSQSDSAFTGRAALLYASSTGLSPYIAYSTSFLPQLGTTRSGGSYDPLTGEQWEAGVKYDLPNADIQLSAAVFDLTQQNVLTPDPVDSSYQIQTGEIRTRGFELEAIGKLTENLTMIASYTRQNPEVTKSNVLAQIDDRPFGVPSEMASLYLDYGFDLNDDVKAGIGGGVRHNGEMEGSLPNSFRVPSYTLFDASFRLEYRNWKLQVNATNLADKKFVAFCGSSMTCSYATGRAVYASIGYKW